MNNTVAVSLELPYVYWKQFDIFFTTGLASACLVTPSNASSERFNSRALRLVQRSPNIRFELVQAKLFLRSIKRSSPKFFDKIIEQYAATALINGKVAQPANLNDNFDLFDTDAFDVSTILGK